MSLYNALHGTNPLSQIFLGMLGLSTGEVGRFRDCHLCDEGIAVYTRNGGGNREDYQFVFDTLSEHPNYIRDEDDSFDCTYATIYFSIPEEYEEDIVMIKLAFDTETPPPEERWADLFTRLGVK